MNASYPTLLKEQNDALDVFAIILHMNASDILQIVTIVKERRLRKIRQVVSKFAKASGGWKKAFPDKQGYVDKFELSAKSGEWCMEELRMLSGDVEILRQHMGIPRNFRTPNRDTASGADALCMLLFKLSWPRKTAHLRAAFGGSGQRVSRIANTLAVFLYNRFRVKLESLDRERLSDEYLMDMARAQYRKNSIMQNIIGFIDATVRPCCRPITPSLSVLL